MVVKLRLSDNFRHLRKFLTRSTKRIQLPFDGHIKCKFVLSLKVSHQFPTLLEQVSYYTWTIKNNVILNIKKYTRTFMMFLKVFF